jgi:hypothetical protein
VASGEGAVSSSNSIPAEPESECDDGNGVDSGGLSDTTKVEQGSSGEEEGSVGSGRGEITGKIGKNGKSSTVVAVVVRVEVATTVVTSASVCVERRVEISVWEKVTVSVSVERNIIVSVSVSVSVLVLVLVTVNTRFPHPQHLTQVLFSEESSSPQAKEFPSNNIKRIINFIITTNIQ